LYWYIFIIDFSEELTCILNISVDLVKQGPTLILAVKMFILISYSLQFGLSVPVDN